MNKIFLANALVTNSKNQMLAVRKKNSNYYQMVGGKLEKQETILQTLQREFLEEIGLDISQHEIQFLGEYETLAVNEKNTLVHANVFHVKLNDQDVIKISKEIEEYVYINKSDYQNYQLAHLLEEFSLPIWLEMN